MADEPPHDLLLTRLHPPAARAELADRPRVSAALERGRRGPLTLVVAPAGSGKTTAVTAWLRELLRDRAARAAWLSLDPEAGEPASFWAYLSAACDRLAPGCADAARPLLRPDQPPAPSAVVAALANRLAALPWDGGPARPAVLVLDDYHAVGRTEVHAGVARLVEHLPPQVHLVITARADPPLPLARLRARGLLAELRAADLRFTPDDLARLRAAAGDPPLSARALESLAERTEGWAAGLQLALLALRDHPDPEAFVRDFAGTHRFLVDYLTDEVLDQQPAHVRRFLLETSVLDRLCGPLCDALLGLAPQAGQAYSSLLIDEAERRGLFLIPLDDERRWYRYHQLFADVLRARLLAQEPGRVPLLHRRASDWLAAEAAADPALLPGAVRHALAAGDVGRAADLVDRPVAELMRGGVGPEARELLRALPPEVVAGRPRLAAAQARATLHSGDLDSVTALLARAESALGGAGLPEGEARHTAGWLAAVRAHEARLREDLGGALAHARAALGLLPAGDLEGRGFATLGLAMARHVAGDLPAACAGYAEATPMLEAAGARHAELLARAMLGTATLMRGDLAGAEAALTAALERCRVGGTTLPAAAHVLQALGEVAYLRDDLAAAEGRAAEGLSLAELGGVRDALLVCHELLVKVDLARGDVAAAGRRAAALLARAAESRIPQLAAWAESVAAWAALEAGDVAAALRWAEGYRPPQGPVGPIRADELVTFLRALLAGGRPAEARAIVGRQLPLAAAGGYREQSLQLLALGALACEELGDRDAADSWLGDALAIAAPQGAARPFLSAGPAMADLLRRYAARRRAPADVAAFLERLVGPAPARGASRAAPPAAGLAERLTPREAEVLRLVAAGHSNQEIADMLVVGVGTVKTHLHSLYGKLDARDRIGAVVRARALGLIA